MRTLLLVALTCGCAHRDGGRELALPTTPSEAELAAAFAALPVIDAHLHTTFDGKLEPTSKIANTRAQLEREFRAAGVVAAVAMGKADGSGRQQLARVIHCRGIDEKTSASQVDAELAKGLYRCIKIYLGYIHRYAYDPFYRPFYALAGKHDVPVVFHTGDTYSTKAKLKFAHPLTIDEVAVDHPKVRFVLAHAGNPWVRTAAEVAYKNPNVYLDGSAFLIGDLRRLAPHALADTLTDPLRRATSYLEDGKKLLFGSDWPLVGIRAYRDAFARAIPQAYFKDVFHDNAVRVFKIPGRTLLP